MGTCCDLLIEDRNRPVDVCLGEGHLDAGDRSHCQPLHLLLFRLSFLSALDLYLISSSNLVRQLVLEGLAEVG